MTGRKEEKCCEEEITANEGCVELKDCSQRGKCEFLKELISHFTHIIEVCGESACPEK